MLMQVAGDHQRNVGHREVLPHDFAPGGERRRGQRFELLLRVREAFVEVVEDLSLVRKRAQLGRVVTAAFAPNEFGMNE